MIKNNFKSFCMMKVLKVQIVPASSLNSDDSYTSRSAQMTDRVKVLIWFTFIGNC